MKNKSNYILEIIGKENEITDQNIIYIFEEVEKLWKEIDYGLVLSSKPRPNEIRFRNSYESEIVIYTNDKSYFKYSPYRNVISISFKEHEVITKTIKAITLIISGINVRMGRIIMGRNNPPRTEIQTSILQNNAFFNFGKFNYHHPL